MHITEVRIKLMDDPHDRLQAFCSITLDGSFVIRDLKIIQGTKGSFVAMPSRKLTDRCPKCHSKNHLRSLFCNQCGARLMEERALKDSDGRARLYADIAHPINSDCREMIQKQVISAYESELVRAREPGYICTYDDYGEESYASLHESEQSLEFIEGNGQVHRIEPAANAPQPPHSLSTPQRDSQNQKATQQSAMRQDDNQFGEGIV
ncbi:MAG: SpoVG family protein [Planctomycetota bacterium]|nr:SpoVG family protein [Planctomycetota bacterium]MDA1212536.1 SpoVG family protein [Planctomycetota bacterium]